MFVSKGQQCLKGRALGYEFTRMAEVSAVITCGHVGGKKKSLHSSAVTASYLGVQRQQQVRNSSSNVGGDFYLQPVFEHVILKRHQITREDSMTPWGKKIFPGRIFLLIFKAKNN